MPYYLGGQPQNNRWKSVAVSQTTLQISASGDGVAGRDYIERVVITAGSTVAPGVVTLFDGATVIFAHQFVQATMTSLVQEIPLSIVADTTKGFNITTGTSVTAVVVGRF